MEVPVKIRFTNTTHWQTRDVQKIVRAAMSFAGWKGDGWSQVLTVEVNWARAGNTYGEIGSTFVRGAVQVNLPKRGPKDDPITMLATAAISDEPVLAPSVVYTLARTLALTFIKDRTRLTEKYRKRKRQLVSLRASKARPTWLPENAFIKRYAKQKPPEKKTFVEKVEDDLGRAEVRVEEWEAQIEHAEAHLKRALRDLKKEQKRLRDARKRAEERGETVERIGRGHRLYGRI